MDNIILLDLDGVLITTVPWEADKMHEDGYSDFNPISVTNFNRILKDTGYDIVLSSARRKEVHRLVMNGYFRNRGVDKLIKDYVPNYNVKGERPLSRREEIERFLEEHQPKNYLIIDDDKSLLNASDEIQSNWVQTYLMTGI